MGAELFNLNIRPPWGYMSPSDPRASGQCFRYGQWSAVDQALGLCLPTRTSHCRYLHQKSIDPPTTLWTRVSSPAIRFGLQRGAEQLRLNWLNEFSEPAWASGRGAEAEKAQGVMRTLRCMAAPRRRTLWRSMVWQQCHRECAQ